MRSHKYRLATVLLLVMFFFPKQVFPAIGWMPQIDLSDSYRFVSGGQLWYPTGYYPGLGTWTMRADGVTLDAYYTALFDRMAERGINYVRAPFSLGEAMDWDQPNRTVPYTVATTRNITIAGQPRTFGVVNLDSFNQSHFDYWKRLINYARIKGIVVQLCIFSSWHVRNPNEPEWKVIYDFFGPDMNTNGLAISTSGAWHATSGVAWDRHVALMQKVVAEFGSLPNVIWEVTNEPRDYYDLNNYGNVITAEGAPVNDWTIRMGNALKSYEQSTFGYNHVVIPNDLHDHQKTPGQRSNWRAGFTDCQTPDATHRDIKYIQSLSDMLVPRDLRFPARPMISDNDSDSGFLIPNDLRKKVWASLTAGAHVDYFTPDLSPFSGIDSADVATGMTYLGQALKFFNDPLVNLRNLRSQDGFVTGSKWCYADRDYEFVVYFPNGGSTTVSNLPPSYMARWYNPRTGAFQPATGGPGFTPPDANDWVLHIKSVTPPLWKSYFDRFNGATGTLNGRVTQDEGLWSAFNTQVVSGQAVPNGEDWRMQANIPVRATGSRSVTLSAALKQANTGIISIGFQTSAMGLYDQTNGNVWFEFNRGGGWSLKCRNHSGVTATLASGALTTNVPGWVMDSTHNYKLMYDSPTNRISVQCDNTFTLAGNVALPFTPSIRFAGFQGARGNSTQLYTSANASVDNFALSVEGQTLYSDTFTNNTGQLNGRVIEPDWNVMWATTNVTVMNGLAVPGGQAGWMLADIPVIQTGASRITIEGSLRQQATGIMYLGATPISQGPFEETNGTFWVQVSRDGQWQLNSRNASGVITTHGSGDLWDDAGTPSPARRYKLVYNFLTRRLQFFVDNSQTALGTGVLNFTPNVQRVGFQGRRPVLTQVNSSTNADANDFVVIVN